MVYDAQHALEHPEVAGWALGSLDPDDVAAFGQHLQTCEQCRGEVAEFTPVAESLALAAPAVEPPADLDLKVVAAVQYAVMADSAATSAVPEAPATTTQADVKPGTTTKAHRWWHLRWTNPLLSALAAAAVTAAAFLGATLFQSAPALAATFTLRPQHRASRLGHGRRPQRHGRLSDQDRPEAPRQARPRPVLRVRLRRPRRWRAGVGGTF